MRPGLNRAFSFVCLTFILSLLGGCATPAQQPMKTNTELNQGKSVPDAPGDAGETSPKPDQPGSDPVAVPVKNEKPAEAKRKESAPIPDTLYATTFLNVRKGPGNEHEVVRVLKKGDNVTPLGKEARVWIKIGENEYVIEKLLSDKAP